MSRSRILRSIMALLLASSAPSLLAVPADLSLTTVTTLANVVAIRNAGDHSARLFLVQQPGIIHVFDQTTNTLLPTPFLDITGLVDDTGNEQGLLGLAFHPDYENNGFFYVNYTSDPPGSNLDRTTIARFSRTANPNVADPASVMVLLEIEQDFSNHNGGDVHFGPDGYLYIGMGDGGSADDPNNRAQDPTRLLGKMLRIDVDNPPMGVEREKERQRQASLNDLNGGAFGRGAVGRCGLVGEYGIPPSNPFVGDGNTCDEIWAIGTRNPFRFSFDRQTGDLFIGDVGQNQVEEIDFQPAASTGGENYGWDCREGNISHSGTCLPGPLVEPIFTYTHSLGCSITGGFRYRGSMPDFQGTYTYADYCSGRIWFGTFAGTWTSTLWSTTASNPTTFGEDRNGELYISSQSGAIRTFTSVQRALFEDGFEVGSTANWSETLP